MKIGNTEIKPSIDWLFNKTVYMIAVGLCIGLLVKTNVYPLHDYPDLLMLLATCAVLPFIALYVGAVILTFPLIIGQWIYDVIKETIT